MPVSVDIVLPCYNPNKTWTQELIRFNEFAKQLYAITYIVVNDGSSDPGISAQIDFLKENNISVTYISYEKNRGKGYALRQGVSASKHAFIVYTDIDFPFTDQSTVAVMERLLEGSNDVVVGYRDTAYYKKKMSSFRKVLSKAFRFFIRSILRMSVTDTQCGLKGFNERGKATFLSTRINRYLFDFEFIFLSGKDKRLKVEPIEVQLKDNVVFSKMRFKILLQESFNLLSVLLFSKR